MNKKIKKIIILISILNFINIFNIYSCARITNTKEEYFDKKTLSRLADRDTYYFVSDKNLQLSDGTTPLLYAIKNDDLYTALGLIEHHVYNEKANKKGITPLMEAVLYNRSGIVKILLEEGVDLDKKDLDGETALDKAHFLILPTIIDLFIKEEKLRSDIKLGNDLVHAINDNDIKKARELLLQGADVNFVDIRKCIKLERGPIFTYKDAGIAALTPLQLAIKEQNKEMVELLLDFKANIEADTDLEAHLKRYFYKPPLIMAISGDIEIAKLLISHGANVDQHPYKGYLTPLMVAVKENKPDMVKLLLDSGANLESKCLNYPRETALEMALGLDYKVIIDLINAEINKRRITTLKSNISKLSQEYLYPESAATIIAEYAVDGDKDVVPKTDSHELLWWNAVDLNEIDTVELLLENNLIDVNTKSIHGNTALHLAAWNNQKELVELLIKNKAKISALTIKGLTAEQLATKKGNIEIVQILKSEALKIKDIARITGLEAYKDPEKYPHGFYLVCSACNTTKFSDVRLFVSHIETHTPKTPYIGYFTQFPTDFFKCNICNEVFPMIFLKAHQAMHANVIQAPSLPLTQSTTTNNLFKCNICNKQFTDKAKLDQHLRTHPMAMPYTCIPCKRGYKTAHGLVKHKASPFHLLMEKTK